MHDHTPDPPFPDACRTGRIEDINDDGTIVRAPGKAAEMAFEEGRQARRDGMARSAKPCPGGPPRKSWDEGWDTSDTILRSLGLS